MMLAMFWSWTGCLGEKNVFSMPKKQTLDHPALSTVTVLNELSQ
jgi:hypothetical protein